MGRWRGVVRWRIDPQGRPVSAEGFEAAEPGEFEIAGLDMQLGQSHAHSMRLKALRAGLLLVWLPAITPVIHAADTNPPPRLTVELRDGSRVVGESVEKSFKFHSDLLGDMKLAVKDIRSVECVATNSVKLATVNGDSLTVAWVDAEIPIKTSFGKVVLPVSTMQKMNISQGGKLNFSSEGLVALWLGENGGCDAIGSHNVTQLTGIDNYDANRGAGFNFNGGENQNMVVPDDPELNFAAGQDFSIEARIKPDHAPGNLPPDEMTIVYKRFAPTRYNYIGYAFYLANNGQLFFLMGDAPMKTGGLIVNAGPDLRDGKFHHVAVTVERRSTVGGRLYIDGKCVLTFDPTNQSGSLSNNEPLLIGCQRTPGYQTPFRGVMDGLAIYKRALRPDEIVASYQASN